MSMLCSWLPIVVSLALPPCAHAADRAPRLSDPAHWFLSQQEIDASREGHSRSTTGILDVSQGNDVRPLINGQAFMASLLVDINAAVSGDSIYMTAFSVDGNVMLDPTCSEPESTKLTTVLIAAAKRNVTLRILVNCNIYETSAFGFCQALNPHCGGSGDCCVPETRHHSNGGNLHAKSWSFIYAREVVSYLGSMDMMGERWDTSAHDGANGTRGLEPYDPTVGHYYGWHGQMFRLRGAVAVDVARHFYLEWNDPAPLKTWIKSNYRKGNLEWKVPSVDVAPGNINAQLVRTLGCAGAVDDGFYQTFAPRGEYSFTDAFKKMVTSARSYIYIEDQFAFYDEAIQMLAEALPHVDAVVIVTDNAEAFIPKVMGFKVTTTYRMRAFHQRRAFDLLRKNASLASKVHIYELARPGYNVTEDPGKTIIYDHAKTYMADDEFVLVGSHGTEMSAFTNDIDLSVGLHDGTAGPTSIAGQMRRTIWGEFLQLHADDAMLRDPLSAVAEFERQADLGNTRVRHYYPSDVADSWLADEAYSVFEIDGRCKNKATGTILV